jgi:hypothetical protein
MELERDLFLTKDGVLCEAGVPEAAFLFHRRGQLVTPGEDAQYGVTAYLARQRSAQEQAERRAVIASLQEKAIQQVALEDKALVPDETADKDLLPMEPRRPGSSGRRG